MAQLVASVPGPWDRDRAAHPAGDWKSQMDAEVAKLDELQQVSDNATIDNPVGFILSFSVADGQALYRVEQATPTVKLAHIPALDGYAIPDAHLRGIRIDDVRKQIEWRDMWKGHRTQLTDAEADRDKWKELS